MFGREVFGVPGNVTEPASFAPNQLIKQGAKLVTGWEDVVEEVEETFVDAVSAEIFEAAAIPLCSGLQVCLPPRSFLPLRLQPQGSQSFYVRAERASLPPHAPNMLAV